MPGRKFEYSWLIRGWLAVQTTKSIRIRNFSRMLECRGAISSIRGLFVDGWRLKLPNRELSSFRFEIAGLTLNIFSFLTLYLGSLGIAVICRQM
ncbi:MAG: hypothetical protein Q7T89_08350 [Anaerolineales bacterium]|nr:hypothetical protein [Anaerolineales bacterium]